MAAAIAVAVLLAGGIAVCGADEGLTDRVVIRAKGRSSRITLQCDILDYTGRGITLRTAVGTVRKYEPSEVLDVRTTQTEHHVRGLIAVSQRKYKQAAKSLEKALGEESRAWVQREILSLLVRCALQTGDDKAAAGRFVELVKSDSSTPHFSLIPLVWSPRTIDREQQKVARRWLLGSESVPRLIAASELLHDDRWGKSAENALKQLSSDVDLRVARLARIQLWRKQLLDGTPESYQLSQWRKDIARLPQDLRGGGYYLLGRGHLLRKENEQAAAALLWVPLVYDRDRRLAARACLEAAEALDDVGRRREAATLYREVQQRFADTPFAREAAARLGKPAKTGKKRD